MSTETAAFIDAAMERSARARRYQCGDVWDGSVVRHVSIGSFWVVTLWLEDGRRVCIDLDDRVLESGRAIDVEVCSAIDNPPVSAPVSSLRRDPPKRKPRGPQRLALLL